VGLVRTLACSAGIIVTLNLLGACTSSAPKKAGAPVTVIVTATPSSTTPSPSPSSSTTPPLVKKLRATCDTVLSRFDVDDALGVQLLGKTAFVVGVAEPGIGRLGYLNCRYGIGTGVAAAPQVEVGVSLYKSPAQATRRAAGTAADYRDHGATETAVKVSGHDGAIFVGTAPGYDIPLLVVTSGQRTVAVSVVNRLAPPGKRSAVMTKLAALAIERTGG
jgi:hypothetical protein